MVVTLCDEHKGSAALEHALSIQSAGTFDLGNRVLLNTTETLTLQTG